MQSGESRKCAILLYNATKSRFLAGALNGNIGVTKSMLAEMTDETNIARAFSLLPLTWAMGAIVGCELSPCLCPIIWLIAPTQSILRRVTLSAT
jgi:hypothetical protein